MIRSLCQAYWARDVWKVAELVFGGVMKVLAPHSVAQQGNNLKQRSLHDALPQDVFKFHLYISCLLYLGQENRRPIVYSLSLLEHLEPCHMSDPPKMLTIGKGWQGSWQDGPVKSAIDLDFKGRNLQGAMTESFALQTLPGISDSRSGCM